MFCEDADANEIAHEISDKLSEHSEHKSHNRHISRAEATSYNLKIENLEDDQKLQDLVLSVFHSTTHTFANSTAIKIIENNIGKAFIKHQGNVLQPPKIPLPNFMPSHLHKNKA